MRKLFAFLSRFFKGKKHGLVIPDDIESAESLKHNKQQQEMSIRIAVRSPRTVTYFVGSPYCGHFETKEIQISPFLKSHYNHR